MPAWVIVSVVAGVLTAAIVMLGRTGTSLEAAHNRLPGINGLRAAAAFSIFALHSANTSSFLSELTPNSAFQAFRLGVALFFVISGFLLFRPFVTALVSGRRVSFWRYAVNRVFRIVPLFVVVNALVFFKATPGPGQHFGTLVDAVTFSGRDILPVAWSLDDEVRFYLLLPVLYLAAMILVPARWRLRVTISTVVVLTAGSAIYEARLQLQGIDQATGDAIAKFNLFGAGMLLAVVAVTRKPQINGYAAAACLGLAVLSFAVGSAVSLQGGPFGDIPIGLAFALVLGAVAFGPRSSLLVRFLAAGPVVFLGEISYGLYLWHGPVQHALFNAGLIPPQYMAGLVEISMATILVAAGTYFLVEQPALLGAAWLGRHPPPIRGIRAKYAML